MKYEKPNMELTILKAQDIITLSVNNEADEIIQGESNPWQS